MALLALSGCANLAGPHYTLTNYNTLPGWQQDDHAQALRTFLASCDALNASAPESIIGQGALATRADVWQDICRDARAADSVHAKDFFEQHFTPFRIGTQETSGGLFTGYYEPLLHGSRHRHGAYQTPLYGLPDDIKTGTPYLTRAEIEHGALAGRGLEILWVDDAVDAFFLHVQGSGRVLLDSGETIRMNFAGKNQQPYTAIGRVLRDAGQLPQDQVNMFTIKQWLRAHPDRAAEMMQRNASFVFFREASNTGGPQGAQRVPLTPRRSLAVDAQLYPYGLPLYIDTALADGQAFRHLMIAQDTGSAIRGAVRGDIFFGSGKDAEKQAAYLQSPGAATALIPNAIASTLH